MSGGPGAPLSKAMTAGRLFVLLAVIFGSLAWGFVPRMEASGDEPHYLVMAQSLGREHDLDLRDNYAREDWREFRAAPTEPHYAAPRRDGRPFPGHAPGLPFLLAPVYALGGRLACAILMGLMVAATGSLTFHLARREGLGSSASLVAGLAAAGPPLAAFGLHVYTEAAATLSLFSAFALLRFGGRASTAALAGGLACALPFLHPRMAVGAIAIAIAALLLRDRSPLLPFVGASVCGAALYAAFWTSIFGVPTGLGVYGGAPEDAAFDPGQALMGLLVDRAYGLLPYAPQFFALVLVGASGTALLKRGAPSRREGVVEIVFVAAVLLPVLFWRVWWGGQSPPARLIAPMTPFLALALARVWDGPVVPAVRRFIGVALAWSWGLFLFAALQPGRLLFINKRVRPTRMWDALWPGGPFDALLPDMARPEASDWPLAIGWMAGLVILGLVVRRRGTRVVDEPFAAGPTA